MSKICYIPVLKGKEGEYSALSNLTSDVKETTCPLIEVPEIPFDYVTERPAKTLDTHIEGIAKRLKDSWGDTNAFYIDIPWITEKDLSDSGDHPLSKIVTESFNHSLHVVPVSGLNRPKGYQKAVKETASKYGLCLRLSITDFSEDRDIDTEIKSLLDELCVDTARTDLLIDLGDLGTQDTENAGTRDLMLARAILASLPYTREWRTLALAAASFPINLGGLAASTTTEIPRAEWRLWNNLRRHPQRLKEERIPIFCDYAISHPSPTEMDPRIMRMSASIRYTLDDKWLIVKGKNVRDHGYEQYRTLSQALIENPHFYGADFSWGDKYIADCAQGHAGPGNATTWRKVGTNHHITVVARQLANLVDA